MNWSNTVPLYEFENSTKYDDMNKPLQSLIDRTDWLKQQVEQMTAGQNLIGTFDNLDSETVVGDAVYVDDTGEVKKALAGFSTEFAADGSFRLARSGYVLGIVIEKTNATSGTVFTMGTMQSQSLADDALGAGAAPGIYRLSMTNDGELTDDEQELDILVVQYHGAGVMTLFDKRAAIPNHIHQTYVLDQAWLVESDSSFDEMEKPAGATYGYDIFNDANMLRIFATVPGAVRIFGDGVLLAETEVIGNEDNLWWVTAGTDPTDYAVLTATITMPYTFGEPVLRGARTDNPDEILLSALQGILTVNLTDWTYEDVAAIGKAVVAFDGRTAKRSPVVSEVAVVGDLQETTNQATGLVTLSLGQGINTFIEPQIVNLNNAIEANDGYYTYYALPADRDSFMLGRISLPYFSGATLQATIVAEVQGLAAGGAIPALAVSYAVQPYQDVATPMPSAWDASITLPTDVIPANNGKIVAAVATFAVTSKGAIHIKLGFDTPTEDIKITRFGVILS